jgi:hypothetical protein
MATLMVGMRPFFLMAAVFLCVAYSEAQQRDDFADFEKTEAAKNIPSSKPAPEKAPLETSAPVTAPVPALEPAPVTEPTPAPPPPPSVPPVKRKKIKAVTARTKEFPKGLYFDSNMSKMPPMEFEYDLSQDDGKTLIVGNTLLNEKTFYVALGNLNRWLPRASDTEGKQNILLLRWPEDLLKNGVLEMISRSGSVLWKTDINDKDVQGWKSRLSVWQKNAGIDPKNMKGHGPAVLSTQMGIFEWDTKVATSKSNDDWFRFCLSQMDGNSLTRLCSSRYMLKKTKSGGMVLAKQVITDATVRVLVRNEEAPTQGKIEVAPDVPVQFYADLSTGVSYEFVAIPPKLNIADMAEMNDPNFIRVIGWDIFPLAPYRPINREQYGRLTEILGFQPTIKDNRKFWESALPADNPVYYFVGSGGGVFKQTFDLSNVPPSAARVFLHKNTPRGTYANAIWLRGRKNPAAKISSDEWSVDPDPSDPNDFEWSFKAAEPGEINRSYLQVYYNKKPYRSYFEIYRSYSNELSGRFSGVYSGSALAVLGEVAYNHWFDTLFGWTNYTFSRQRWGIASKYFKSVNPLPLANGTSGILDVAVVDLKYRLSPGLWTRDETVGLIGSYQNVNFGDLKAPMLGVGTFWARSMPAVFDWIFNYFPLMDYPKWVDMEFIYYPMPMAANVKLGGCFAMNFHGQVLWKKNIFGEAGFGIKRYAIADESVGHKGEINTFYGTVGLGLKF